MASTPSIPPGQLERIRPVIEQLRQSFQAVAAGLSDDTPSAVDLDMSGDLDMQDQEQNAQ